MFLASGSPVAPVIIGRGGDTDTGMRWREGGSGEGGGRDGSQGATGCEVLGVTRTWEVQKRFSLKPWDRALVCHDLFPEPAKANYLLFSSR